MSNLTPRPPLPPPAAPAICRVQPLVPELSLFVPGHSAPPPPPRPHQPPTHHLQPQSDLSRQFNRTEATLFLSGSSSDLLPRKVQWSDQQSAQSPGSSHHHPPPPAAAVGGGVESHKSAYTVSHQTPPTSQPAYRHNSPPLPPRVPQPHQSPVLAAPDPPRYETPPASRGLEADWRSPVHPDILAVLNWQNEQLARLQDQVSRLLTASPGQAQANTTTRDVAVGSPVLRRAATVSTNTSSSWPPAPASQGDVLGGDMDLVSQVSEASRLTPVKTQVEEGVGGAWQSPVLGESVSMYERESQLGSEREEQEMYENILGKVRKLLSQEETDQDHHPVPAPAPVGLVEQPRLDKVEEEAADIPNQTEATWERLRQLGVSFISPGDLAPAGSGSEQPYNSVWLPQAKQPTLLDSRSTPDSSLAINNLALKYLSDQELSKLATLHNKKEAKGKLVLDRGG